MNKQLQTAKDTIEGRRFLADVDASFEDNRDATTGKSGRQAALDVAKLTLDSAETVVEAAVEIGQRLRIVRPFTDDPYFNELSKELRKVQTELWNIR